MTPRADPGWGEARVACVVVDDAGVGAQELDDFCRQNLTGFNRPKAYHFLQSLPRNSNGKVAKTHLRTTYAAPTQIPAVAPKSPATPKDRT
jgi:acyl-CoA synthetase (AMP-forming)/AMP-acid ligase II